MMRLSACWKTLCRCFYTLLLVGFSAGVSFAQVIDRISVEEREDDADIVIQFNERIQYQRHVPKEEGNVLRLYFVLTDSVALADGLMQQTVTAPRSARLPKISAYYPELRNAMLMTFSQPTRFVVRPGSDEKSIVITVPLLPEKTSPVPGKAVQEIPPSPQPVKEEQKHEQKSPESLISPAPTTGSPAQTEQPSKKADTEAVNVAKKDKNGKAPRVEAVKSKSKGKLATPESRNDEVKLAQPLKTEAVVKTELAATTISSAGAQSGPSPLSPPSGPGTSSAPGTPSGSEPEGQAMPPVQGATASPDMSAEETEEKARHYLQEAQSALTEKDPARAINRLNRILGLAANTQTEVAQALIGQARELSGELNKAKAEYRLYLKLFPNGQHAALITQKLAALESAMASGKKPPVQRARGKDQGPAPWMVFGNISANQYRGRSTIDSVQTTPASLIPTEQSLSMVDQNSIVASVNLNARKRDATTDTRFVFRDTDLRNMLSPNRSYNRIYSAYGEHTDRETGYFIRGGRQNPAGSGVMSRFDGVTGYYSVNPDVRIGGVYGDAVEFGSPFKRNFRGVNIERPAESSRVGLNFYFIEQTIDGYLDRRAVGTEARYFDGAISGFAILDYDVLYKDINIAMLQGNYLTENGDSFYFNADMRRSPSFGLTNALGLPGYDTIQSLVNQFGMDELRRMSKGNTAIAEMMSVGATHRISTDWQIGADYRTSRISGSHPVQLLSQLCPDFVPGDPISIQACTFNGQPITIYCSSVDIVNGTCTTSAQGSGTTQSVSLQLLGSNLMLPNAVGVANFSYTSGETFTGQALNLSYIVPIDLVWRLDANVSYYTQHDNAGGKADRMSPSVKLSYQWGSSLNLEAQIGQDIGKNSGAMYSDKSKRSYLYTGARWDLR